MYYKKRREKKLEVSAEAKYILCALVQSYNPQNHFVIYGLYDDGTISVKLQSKKHPHQFHTLNFCIIVSANYTALELEGKHLWKRVTAASEIRLSLRIKRNAAVSNDIFSSTIAPLISPWRVTLKYLKQGFLELIISQSFSQYIVQQFFTIIVYLNYDSIP